MSVSQNSVGVIPVSNPIPVQQPSIPEGGVTLVTLSAEHKRKWDDTLSMMMWKAPGMQHLFYTLLDAKGSTASDYSALMTTDVPWACTDGQHISINPEPFFKLTLPQRVFVLAHEVAHNARGDVETLNRLAQSGRIPMNDGTSLPFDEDTVQESMDVVINAWLIESDIGDPVPEGVYDAEASGADSWVDVYQKRYKAPPPGKKQGGQQGQNHTPNQGAPAKPGGFDKLVKPGALTGQNPAQAAAKRSPDKWGVELTQALALEKMKRHGLMPEGFSRFFEKLLEPKVTWQEHIQMLINRAVGDGSLRWDLPHPYLGNAGDDQYFMPAPTGFGAGWILVFMDTSGSVGAKELLDGATEVVGLLEEVTPQRLTVIWNDAAISYVDEVSDRADMDAIRKRGVKGGGGTNYAPVLKWIEKNGEGDPDLFIGFTDGYMDYPSKPHRFPTIWASSTDFEYPFGDVVRLNHKPDAA